MGRLLLEAKNKDIDIVGILHHGTAVPDQAKNKLVSGNWSIEQPRRNSITDMNRSAVVKGFMGSEAEWLMWLDDDTVPPKGFLTHLLSLGRDFVGGLYFLGGEPYNPIAYLRDMDGLYHPYYNYPHGALVQVDSIGMGCTLIHRSVYEKIRDAHTVLQRPDGSLVAVYNAQKYDEPFDDKGRSSIHYSGGWQHTRLTEPAAEDDRPFPFYAMEYGRTEDHYFCEMAERVGVKPWIDTTVVCEHWKPKSIGRKEYLEYKGKLNLEQK